MLKSPSPMSTDGVVAKLLEISNQSLNFKSFRNRIMMKHLNSAINSTAYLIVLIVGIWIGLKWMATTFLCPATERTPGVIKWPLGVLSIQCDGWTNKKGGTQDKQRTGNENDGKKRKNRKLRHDSQSDLIDLLELWCGRCVASRDAVLLLNGTRCLGHHSISRNWDTAGEICWVDRHDASRSFLLVRQEGIFKQLSSCWPFINVHYEAAKNEVLCHCRHFFGYFRMFLIESDLKHCSFLRTELDERRLTSCHLNVCAAEAPDVSWWAIATNPLVNYFRSHVLKELLS